MCSTWYGWINTINYSNIRLKLLWVPIIDALYIGRYGRRKTWLISVQYIIGLVMIILPYHINDILLATQVSTNNQPRFLLFWGIIFIISTTLIALLKHEIDENYDPHEPHFVILLTAKIDFAATDAMTGLELIERGVTRDSLALLAIRLTPL
ncbi:unnamed protein product [Rotaria sp. Silwood1]|nr:unnamed protein product [Rotaria sp. Silwood1]